VPSTCREEEGEFGQIGRSESVQPFFLGGRVPPIDWYEKKKDGMTEGRGRPAMIGGGRLGTALSRDQSVRLRGRRCTSAREKRKKKKKKHEPYEAERVSEKEWVHVFGRGEAKRRTSTWEKKKEKEKSLAFRGGDGMWKLRLKRKDRKLHVGEEKKKKVVLLREGGVQFDRNRAA